MNSTCEHLEPIGGLRCLVATANGQPSCAGNFEMRENDKVVADCLAALVEQPVRAAPDLEIKPEGGGV